MIHSATARLITQLRPSTKHFQTHLLAKRQGSDHTGQHLCGLPHPNGIGACHPSLVLTDLVTLTDRDESNDDGQTMPDPKKRRNP
jgi:hypothetical protein